jgi:hypothetical protein
LVSGKFSIQHGITLTSESGIAPIESVGLCSYPVYVPSDSKRINELVDAVEDNRAAIHRAHNLIDELRERLERINPTTRQPLPKFKSELKAPPSLSE